MIPVPLHPWRLWRRRLTRAEFVPALADGHLTKMTGLPVLNAMFAASCGPGPYPYAATKVAGFVDCVGTLAVPIELVPMTTMVPPPPGTAAPKPLS